MTATAVRQLRLPGQAAAQDGRNDLTNMYLAHHGFRRDLAAFTKAVPVTPVEDREAWQALAARWAMFAEVLHHHHRAEDDWLWPLLIQRADTEAQAVLHAMEAEHADIDPALEACAEGFRRLAASPDVGARSALSVRMTALRESLGRHLEHEETEALRIVQQEMAVEEWNAFEKRIEESIRLSEVFRLVPWAMHEVPTSAREQVFTSTGAAHRLLWRLSRRRFERLDRTAFRHLPG